MEVASKNACVLLDANLKDSPELIEQFVARWREGYDVVYGRRLDSEASSLSQLAARAFYRVFNYFSYIKIPHNVGDFSLIEKRVVESILRFPERDVFLRGIRTFAGFRQIEVPYRREHTGKAPNQAGFLYRIRLAKHGILSFTNVPLTILSLLGAGLLLLSLVLGFAQAMIRILYPERSASGITTVLLAVLFFGALNAFSLGLVGEYVGRIFEEVKRRPHFIRRVFIRDGEIRRAADSLAAKEG
jgi:hypothetical protein